MSSDDGSPLVASAREGEEEEKTRLQTSDGGDSDAAAASNDVVDDLSDDDSVLSEVDEAQFENFDPTNIAIEARPVAVDETNVGLLGVHKRKRADGDREGEGAPKKKKESKREKKSRRKKDSDDDFSGGEELQGKRERKSKPLPEAERKKRNEARARATSPENEEHLTPEERRRRELDRAMDAAMKSRGQRRSKKDGEDLARSADDEIEALREAMVKAAQLDSTARSEGKPAMHKLKLLPSVTQLLSRNSIRENIVDPDTNLLEAVKFFLEPLEDGSLPAYNIQRDLFSALLNLPIGKEALISSGIGKVTLFYTKSKRPEQGVKRMAERLISEWSRPILKRSDDYHQKRYETKDYVQPALPHRPPPPPSQVVLTAAQHREKLLAQPPRNPNRARLEDGPKSYTVVPRSTNVVPGLVRQSGDALSKKMKAARAKR
ncbi:MAG: Transcription factor iws1 [Vezdaea acicularis]|nr:MAG: Transcription factor iws1 [Vezdaea acicularis]